MSGSPIVLTTVDDLQSWRASAGPPVLVPTMGALHEGHRQLITAAGRNGQPVLVSIFVNPLQFGPGEDFDRYPRTPETDLEICTELGVDAVFMPPQSEMYSTDFTVTASAGRMGMVLEGASRPGHFDGVLTVVLKLFNLTRPETAIFGLKDIQQYALVNRMVTDLNLEVAIHGVDIVREPGGLAMSSRNNYLSSADRGAALALSGALRAGAQQAETPAAITTAAQQVLTAAAQKYPAFRLDYLELVDFDTFTPVAPASELPARSVLAVAAHVGNIRLIDNTRLGPGWR
jgi:pantoate--beta-alanine ligase